MRLTDEPPSEATVWMGQANNAPLLSLAPYALSPPSDSPYAARRGVWRSALRKVVPEALVALKASPSFRATAGALPLVRTAYARFGKKLIKPAALAPAKQARAADARDISLVPEPMIDYFSNPSIFSIEKARSELGYQPRYSLKDGMALTEQWARWANLIP